MTTQTSTMTSPSVSSDDKCCAYRRYVMGATIFTTKYFLIINSLRKYCGSPDIRDITDRLISCCQGYQASCRNAPEIVPEQEILSLTAKLYDLYDSCLLVASVSDKIRTWETYHTLAQEQASPLAAYTLTADKKETPCSYPLSPDEYAEELLDYADEIRCWLGSHFCEEYELADQGSENIMQDAENIAGLLEQLAEKLQETDILTSTEVIR